MEWFASTLQFIMHSAHDLNKCVLIWQLPLASPTNQTVSVCITSFSNMHSSGTIWSLTLDPDESMCSGWVRFDERTSSRGKGDGSFPSIYVYQGDYEEVMVILLVKWKLVAFCLSIYFHLHLSTFSFQFYFPSILTPFHFFPITIPSLPFQLSSAMTCINVPLFLPTLLSSSPSPHWPFVSFSLRITLHFRLQRYCPSSLPNL